MTFNPGDLIEVSVPVMNAGSQPVNVDVSIAILEDWPLGTAETKVYSEIVQLTIAPGETRQAVISYVDNDVNAVNRDVVATVLLHGSQDQVGQEHWQRVYAVGEPGGLQWYHWLLIGGGVAVAGYAAVKIFGERAIKKL